MGTFSNYFVLTVNVSGGIRMDHLLKYTLKNTTSQVLHSKFYSRKCISNKMKLEYSCRMINITGSLLLKHVINMLGWSYNIIKYRWVVLSIKMHLYIKENKVEVP